MKKQIVELEPAAINETPRLSHLQTLWPGSRDAEAVMLLRAALPVHGCPPRQYVRAEQGATIVQFPLGEEEVRHLAELLNEAVQILDADRKDRAH